MDGPPFDLGAFAERACRFLGGFQDPPGPLGDDLRGAFASRAGGAPDLYGACDAAYALWILGELEERSTPAGRRAWAERIRAGQDPASGWFQGALLPGHGPPHATAFATGALLLLGSEPAHPLAYAERLFASRAAIDAWLDGFRWSQIWTGSHAAGAAAALIDAPRGVGLPADWSRDLLAALDARVDPRTGLWKRGPLDRLWRRPTPLDLGGAAHFWWLYARLGRPIPRPEAAIDAILGLQRRSGLWGSRLFGGAFPQGLDFDALHGLRIAWSDASPSFRSTRRGRLERALDRYARTAARMLGTDGWQRWIAGPHKLVGTLDALAELDRLSRELLGDSLLRTPRPWRSALERVSWQ